MIFKINPNHNYNLERLKTHVCAVPYTNFQVYEDGKVEVCCRSWMKKVIGDFNVNTAEEIINSPVLQHIIEDMESGQWSYCTDVCPQLSTFLNSDVKTEFSNDITIKEEWKNKKLRDYIVYFNNDRSCNLQCPSCRNEFIHVSSKKAPEAFAKLEIIQNRIKDLVKLLLKKENARTVAINITGSGDPFASELYWNYLLELNEKVVQPEYEKIRINFQTNGVLMTPEKMNKIKNLWRKINWIAISVDADTQETYSIVRKRGNLKAVKENINWLNERVKAHDIGVNVDSYLNWVVNFIVQVDNYKEMISFAEYYIQYETILNIWYNPIADWGHLNLIETDSFQKKAIWLKTHPEYSNFIETLKHPVFNDKKVNIGSLVNFKLK